MPHPEDAATALPGGVAGRAVRALVNVLVRLFFPDVRLSGGERIPAAGPVIFVPNHNNGLLDPIVLRLATGLPVRFLAKSTLFGNPLGKLAMTAFGAIPVYRARDAAGAAGAAGGAGEGSAADEARAANNERTFALCRAALARHEPLALFPEGTSHSDPMLKPFKTGAARIALSAEAEHGFALGLWIVPAAITYDAKTIFRSTALVTLGEPIEVRRLAAEYVRDAHEAARALTATMRERLEAEVLTADTRELLEGLAAVSGFSAETAEAAHDAAKRHERAKAMRRAYRTTLARDPAAVDSIVAEAQAYVRTLRELGVQDPWAVEVGRVRTGAAVREVAVLLSLSPWALVGALLSWVPYRLVGVAAKRAEEDVQSTVKLVLGMFVLPLWWLLLATATGFAMGLHAGSGGRHEMNGVGVSLGLRAAAAMLVLVVPTGYAALRFDERFERARMALRYAWLRRGRPGVARDLVRQRQALATRVEAALREAGESGVTPMSERRRS